MKREIEYLVLDLQIQKSDTAYRVQVLDSPAGQASVNFSLPFGSLEIENYLLRFNRQQRGVRRIDSPELQSAKTFGGGLFRAVFQGEVLKCLRGSLGEAARQEKGLRILLRLTEVPELIDLPWELLHDPAPLNKFLALSDWTPVVRYLDLPEPIRTLLIKPPLRVLVVISSPTGYPPLDTEGEWKRLGGALQHLEQSGQVALERLDEATLSALQQRLRRGEYHVFHFIGHGGFDPTLQDGVLLLEDEQENGRPVSGQDLGVLLQGHRSMRLVLLNACEGARASATDPFGGTAQSLVQQGIPSVVAMQFEISDEAALTFASEFYGALADGYPVDAALSQSRQAIYLQGRSIEWATPVLYLRTPNGRIFDIDRTGLQTPPPVEESPPPVLSPLAFDLQLVPMEASGRAAGSFALTIENRGGGPTTFGLDAEDPGGACTFEFSPPSSTVPAHGSTKVSLTVRPRRRQVLGVEKLHPFMVKAAPRGDESQGRTVSGRFFQRPLIPATSAAIAALLAIVFIVAFMILPRAWSRKTRSLPVVAVFEVKPASIRRGEKAELFWKTSDAETVSISDVGRVDVPSGSTSVAPEGTTTYTLTAANALGPVKKELSVTVLPLPTPPAAPDTGPVAGQFGSFSNFRVTNDTPLRLSFAVDYDYNGAFGVRMDLSASAPADQSIDQSIKMVLPRPRVGRGSGKVTFELTKEGGRASTSRVVRVCMVEPMTQTELQCQDFAYVKTWGTKYT